MLFNCMIDVSRLRNCWSSLNIGLKHDTSFVAKICDSFIVSFMLMSQIVQCEVILVEIHLSVFSIASFKVIQ